MSLGDHRIVHWSGLGDGRDGVARRRRLLPMLGLAGTGWRAASANTSFGDVAAVILDAMERDAEDQAWAAQRAGVPVIVDLARAEGSISSDQALRAKRVVRLATMVTVSAGVPTLLNGLPHPAIREIPDVVEDSARHRLVTGAPARPEATQGMVSPGVLWFAEPGDPGLNEELEWLVRLLPQIARNRQHLTVLAPAEIPATALAPLRGRPDVTLRGWSAETMHALLEKADVLVLPGAPGSAHAAAARRARQALAAGVPVAAASGHCMARLGQAVALDAWCRGLSQQRALTAAVAFRMRQELPGILEAGRAWAALLDEVTNSAAPQPQKRLPARVLMFIDHVTEADLCFPLTDAAARRADVTFTVAISSALDAQSPWVAESFRRRGIKPALLDRNRILKDMEPDLAPFDGLLTPVVTSHNAHRFAARLTDRAKALGIRTYTLQHGLENLGVTWQDPPPAEAVTIPADEVFVWFPPECTPADMAPNLRRRLRHVGSVKELPLTGPALDSIAPGPRVAVFENLHWNRYSDAFREGFVAQLLAAARAFPEVKFLLKPHPGGRFLSQRGRTTWPANLLLLDPADPKWASCTAPALLVECDAMITTPSTCALDGAQAGRPTAVAGGTLDLPAFAPLPILRQAEDWIGFIAQALSSAPDLRPQQQFLDRSMIGGSAVEKVLDAMVAGARARTEAAG